MEFAATSNNKKITLFLAFLAIFAAGASPQTAPGTGERTLVLGVAQFDASALPGGLQNIGTLLPQQLLKRISFFDRIQPSPASLETIAAKKKSSEQNSSRTKIAMLRKDRDSLFFQAMDLSQKSAAISRKEAEIQSALKKMNLDPGKVNANPDDTAFILELHADHAGGTLLPVVSNPLAASALSKADYLIYGKCWERDGYIGYTITVYNSLIQEEILVRTHYAAVDDLGSSLDDAVRPVAQAILERKYSLLTLSIFPNDAAVLLDGRETNLRKLLFLSDLGHSLEVSAAGYDTAKRDFTVSTGEDSTLEISLPVSRTEAVTIDSRPQGSDVYVNSEKIGITPLVAERSSQNKIVRLENEGFNPELFVIGPLSASPQPVIEMELNNGKSQEENFNAAKDDFYRSLGFFVGVLPVSVFSYGTFKMYGQIAAKIASDFSSGLITDGEFDSATIEINPKYYASQAVFWASLAANVLLAGNAVFRLVRYIDSAN